MRTVSPFPAPCVLRSLSAWLGVVLDGLRGAVAAWGGRDRAAVPLVVLAHGRLGRIRARFAALLARLARGSVPAPRPPEPPGRARGGARLPQLPRAAGWLARMLPEARGYASQLQALLADPAMAALLAEVPAAARLLRPLLRMLTIPEHLIAPPRRPRAQPGSGCPRAPATDARRAGADTRPEQVLWPPEWTA